MESTRTHIRFSVGLLIAAGALAVVSCRPGMPKHRWSQEWGPVAAHQTFPGACTICHLGDGYSVLRKVFSFDHKKETGYRLEAAHAQAACLRCHNDRGPVAAYVARGCGGCHGDPHGAALGSDCQKCHGQGNWKPVGPAARDIQTRFHLVPAHAVPPCASCHTEPGVDRPKIGPAQCGSCHEDGAAQPDRRSNAPDDADAKASGLRMGSSHRQKSVLDG